eukprot:8972407-Pyramimonas_sp.AAC.1
MRGGKTNRSGRRDHQRRRITLWISIACTGGSPWQHVSEAMYYRSGNAKALKKLMGSHYTVSEVVVGSSRMAQEVCKRKGLICFEWPTPWRYWHDPQ